MAAPKLPSYRAPQDLADSGLQWFLDQIRIILEYMSGRPDYDRVSYTNVALVADQLNLVRHKLGRAPAGWRITRLRSPAIVYENTSNTDATSLCLVCTQSVTVDLEVW